MKLNGTLWQPQTQFKQGFFTSDKNGKKTRYAHLNYSVGRAVALRVDGAVVMENGKPKTTWVNDYYSITAFNGLSDKLQELLNDMPPHCAVPGGKGLRLEISGENEQKIVTDKSGNPKIVNNFRVISLRVEGESLWWTTANGELVQRALN